MRRSTVLSLPLQLVFPGWTLSYYNNLCIFRSCNYRKCIPGKGNPGKKSESSLMQQQKNFCFKWKFRLSTKWRSESKVYVLFMSISRKIKTCNKTACTLQATPIKGKGWVLLSSLYFRSLVKQFFYKTSSFNEGINCTLCLWDTNNICLICCRQSYRL